MAPSLSQIHLLQQQIPFLSRPFLSLAPAGLPTAPTERVRVLCVGLGERSPPVGRSCWR